MHTENRACLYRTFIPLNAGRIKPEGWLERWQRINAYGWTLTYAQKRIKGVYDKFWDRNKTADFIFDDNDQGITLCDYTSYFADSLVRYAVLNPGSPLESEWREWLANLLASQDACGYLGAFIEGVRWKYWLEIFSQALVIDAMLFWYEAHGDKDILRSCEKAMSCIITAWNRPEGDVIHSIFGGHGTVVIRTANKLYEITGNAQYLTFSNEVFEKYGHTEAYETLPDALVHKHNAAETEHVGIPAMMYEYCGNERYLEASRKAWKMMEEHLCVDGQPHGGEMMTHVGARINCEHCSAVELFYVANAMARITGEIRYMDAAELCMLNAYPAAKEPGGMMLAYSHAPNQLSATEWGVPHNNDIASDWRASREFFSSAHEPLCCNSNGPRGIPHYLASMVAMDDEGPVVIYYGPCCAKLTVCGKPITLKMDTAYPYEDEVRIELQMESSIEFAIKLRIPGWSGAAEVLIDGQVMKEVPIPGEMLTIRRLWQSDDVVTLRFRNPLRLQVTRKPEFGIRATCCTIHRGALLYTLPVEEDWQFYTAPAHGPGKEIISSKVIMKSGAKWNYAILMDPEDPDACGEFVKLCVPEDAKPFDVNAPVGIRVKARRVENWYPEGDPEHLMTPGAPFLPMRLSDTVEDITLIPYGHTCLRMTYLPLIVPT